MSILSLYSKIQLKIGRVEGELKHTPTPLKRGIKKSPLERGWGVFIKRGINSLRLLFWKTAKVVVRFFALLFEDSSNNFLIFTRLDKDSVFVCNNSYCNSPLERGRGVLKKVSKESEVL